MFPKYIPLRFVLLCTLGVINFTLASEIDTQSEGDIVGLAGVSVAGDYGPWACTGREDNSKGGKGPRPFKVTCRDKKKNVSLTCNFNGNPHPCSAYNKKGNAPKFYGQMLNIAGQFIQNNNNCGPESIVTKLCSDVTYVIVK